MADREVAECPFHSRRWRGASQQLLNALRGRILLPRHIRQFPKTVCTCKGAGVIDHPYSISDLEEWCAASTSSSSSVSAISPLLKRFLKSAADSESQLSAEDRAGLVATVVVIKQATEGDYHNLEPKKPKDTTTGHGPPEPVILKECFELPLSSNYLGVFLGAGGKHIKPLCNQYKVQMHLGEESGSESSGQGGGRNSRGRGKQYVHLSGDAIKVTVCSKPEDKPDVKRFKEELVKRAEIVTKSREKHQENVAAFSKVLQERREKRAQIQSLRRAKRMMQGGIYGDLGNPKEELAEQFEKKQLAKSRQSGGKTSTGGNSVLSEGHCLHCLAPYDRENKDCKYHSGYLAAVKADRPNQGYSWSCCKKRTASKHPTHDLHSRTGCCSGQHLWRPGKQGHVKGKGGASSAGGHKDTALANDTEDFSV